MDYYNDIRDNQRGASNLFTHSRRGTLGMRVPFLVFLCSLFVILPGCSPKIVEKVVTKIEYVDVHHRDTLITKDSVYIREWLKGDTVYVEKYRDKYVYRDRWRDSISVREVHDTTAVEVKVEKPLSVAQKAKIGAFWWLLGAVLALGAWTFRKPILALLKKFI